jgi:hypothetical protein
MFGIVASCVGCGIAVGVGAVVGYGVAVEAGVAVAAGFDGVRVTSDRAQASISGASIKLPPATATLRQNSRRCILYLLAQDNCTPFAASCQLSSGVALCTFKSLV